MLFVVRHLALGGAEQVIYSIAQGLNPDKVTLHILTTEKTENVWQTKFNPYTQNIFTPNASSHAIYRFYFRYLIRKLGVKVVLVTNAHVFYRALPALKAEFPDVKFVDLIHTETYFAAAELERSAPYFDQRICISNKLHSYIRGVYQQAGLNSQYSKRLLAIHNGIDLKKYQPNSSKGAFKAKYQIRPDTKLITFIGRFSDEKNPALFVRVALTFLHRFPDCDVKFVMAGDGLRFHSIKAGIEKSGFASHFVLTGLLNEVPQLLDDSYLLLVVSEHEGLPLVAVEALAMGVPVISTDVGAVSEALIDGVNGYIIRGNDVSLLFVEKIAALLTGKLDYSSLAKHARASIVPEFALETMADRYRAVFENA